MTDAPRHLAYMPLDDLTDAMVNPKEHDGVLIEASIDRFGFLDVPVLDERTGRLVAGHGRRDQLLAMHEAGKPAPDGIMVDEKGRWLVPTLRGWSSADDDAAHAAGIAINRAGERGGWNDDSLLPLLQELATLDGGLTGIGFDPADLDQLTFQSGLGPTVLARTIVPLADLKPHPRNYRVHPDEQLDHLGASLQQHGFLRNVVVARDNTILIGHGIVQAAQRIGLESAPVTRLDLDPDSPEAFKVLVVDELAQFAEVDDRQLTELLREVNDGAPGGLFGTGYDEMILANLLMVTRTADEFGTMDQAAEWIGMPDYEAERDPWRLIVAFDSQEERSAFLDEYGIREVIAYTHAVRQTISARWPIPDVPRNDAGLKWEDIPDPLDAPIGEPAE